jgi:S1-C subfamily serine protease
MFQDVHQGGPAYSAGIRPGDLLLGNGERQIRPPDDLTFSIGESANLLVEKLHGGQQTVKVQLAMPIGCGAICPRPAEYFLFQNLRSVCGLWWVIPS